MVVIALALLGCCVAVTFFYPRAGAGAAALSDTQRALRAKACSLPEFFSRYRRYCLSLAGVLFLAAFHAMARTDARMGSAQTVPSISLAFQKLGMILALRSAET